MTTTPPGWYDDGSGVTRWWDGQVWTEHVQPPVAPPEPGPVADQPAPGSAPVPGVPPWHPEAPAPQPLPVPPPSTPSSKGWVLPVVIVGGVLVVFAILAVVAALVIPMFLNLQAGTGTGGGVDVDTEEQAAAADVVERYDDAWDDGDCDAFLATTTEAFRDVQQIADCDQFAEASQSFNDSTDDYELEVTGVEVESEDRILVFTTETYSTLIDDNGDLGDPRPAQDDYRYILVLDDGVWLIDDASIL